MVETHKKINDPKNTEISINYYNDFWNRNDIIIDDMFAFSVAYEIMHDDYEPRSIIECLQRQDWPKWEEAIKTELSSLTRRVWAYCLNPRQCKARRIQMSIC